MNASQHNPAVTFLNRAKHDGDSCGDQGEYWIIDDKVILCLVDGLGHGELAKNAARFALSFVNKNLAMPLPELFHECDRAVRHSRGVAMAVAVIDRTENVVNFAGVGNIHGAITGEKNVRLASNAGIIGGGFRHVGPEVIPLSDNGMVGLFTDGINQSVDMTKASNAAHPDLPVLANNIYETWGLDSDDAGILIFRNE